MKAKTIFDLEHKLRIIARIVFFTMLFLAVILLFLNNFFIQSKVLFIVSILLFFHNCVYVYRNNVDIGAAGVSVITLLLFALSLKINTRVEIFICGILVIFFAFFVILFGIMFLRAYEPQKRGLPMNAIIVLGTKLDGKRPGKTLVKRLEKTIQKTKGKPEVALILTGGKQEGSAISEAEAMESFLKEYGIANVIILDKYARNTEENILNAKRLLDIANIHDGIFVLSSDYHILRTSLIAKKHELNIHTIAATTPFGSVFQEWCREALVTCYTISKLV